MLINNFVDPPGNSIDFNYYPPPYESTHEVIKEWLDAFIGNRPQRAYDLGKFIAHKNNNYKIIDVLFNHLDMDIERFFVRGIFDTIGEISPIDVEKSPCAFMSVTSMVASSFKAYLNPKPECAENLSFVLANSIMGTNSPVPIDLTWSGSACMDFLGYLYDGYISPDIQLLNKPENYKRYHQWRTHVPGLTESFNGYNDDLTFEWTALTDDAIEPLKTHPSDSGFDLYAVKELEKVGNVNFYGTGIAIKPPHGWYIDVVPRSSIVKSGYILANCTGVIDQGYRGEIKIGLIKIDENTPDLKVPFRVVQMIPRPIVHPTFKKVKSLDNSGRGSGSYGSTGQH